MGNYRNTDYCSEKVVLSECDTENYVLGHSIILGDSRKMQRLQKEIELSTRTSVDVLIRGESGTGKELVAENIHIRGERFKKPFVVCDCTTLNGLFESQLFGYKKGSFTGAYSDRKGLVEVACEGTLFLDEIGELNLSEQSKLLRLLQERQYRMVGSTKTKKTNARIISATNRDLESMVGKGDFRQDLYYRLDGDVIHVPSLKERKDDIVKLAYHFLCEFNRAYGSNFFGFSDSVKEQLVAYNWPGNVRELKNAVQKSVRYSVLDDMYEGLIITDHLSLINPNNNGEVKESDTHWFSEGVLALPINHMKGIEGAKSCSTIVKISKMPKKILTYEITQGVYPRRIIFITLETLNQLFLDCDTADYRRIKRLIKAGGFNDIAKKPFQVYNRQALRCDPSISRTYLKRACDNRDFPVIGIKEEDSKFFVITEPLTDKIIPPDKNPVKNQQFRSHIREIYENQFLGWDTAA